MDHLAAASKSIPHLTLLPSIRKEHAHEVKLVPSLPRIPSSRDDCGSTCRVCQTHEARYTCPRCEMPYCSLPCYRAHNENPAAATAKGGQSRSCNESFFQARVSQVVSLEVQEQKQQTRRMIQNVYQQQHQEEGDEEEYFQPTTDLCQRDLVRILRALEQQDEVGSSGEEVQLLVSSLSPQIQQSLDHAIRSGQIQDWVLEPWYPWWRAELVKVDETLLERDNDVEETIIPKKTLDERTLDEIPPFSRFRLNNSSAAPPPPELKFHLVDLLHAVLGTLYLYHGVENASCRENCIEAAESLIQASSVLSRDARYTELEQVLIALVCNTDMDKGSGGTVQPNNIVLRDVALVCANFRLVARALLEGTDILKCAIQELDHRNNKPTKVRLKHICKKMEFFQSWSKHLHKQYGQAMFEQLGNSVQDWLAKWSSSWRQDPILI